MNVVIVNAYNRRNGGDAALLSALLDQIHATFPEATIDFASLESPLDQSEFEGAHNLGSIRRWVGEESISRSRRIGRKIAALGLAIAPTLVLRGLVRGDASHHSSELLGEIRAIARSDLVVGLGGGYLNGSASMGGTLNVVFLLLPLWLATRFHRSVVLAPQSYGPFGRRLQTTLVRHCLNRVDRIVVRENGSLDQLRAVGVRPRLVERGVDSAFVFGHDPRPTVEHPGSLRVGVTVRDWLPAPDQESYERSIAAFIDWLARSRRASVILIPQVTSDYQQDDDRLVSRRVASYCVSTPSVLDDSLDHGALRALYGGLDYVVGTRFHSVIFSLSSGTPALAIEYEHKTSGIMRDLGLEDWVIPMNQVTAATLCERFMALEAGRLDYVQLLADRLPAYRDRARNFTAVLRQSVP